MALVSFLSTSEIALIGFKYVGKDPKISRFSQFYSPETISIGDNVRIDDFCILSGNISMGSHIHISAYSALFGKSGIELNDFTGLSPRTTLFSESDDFSGDYLIGPQHNKKFTNVKHGKIILEKYTQTGANVIVLPGVTIGQGSVIGALSLVNCNIPEWSVFGGIPARFIKPRNRKLLDIIKIYND